MSIFKLLHSRKFSREKGFTECKLIAYGPDGPDTPHIYNTQISQNRKLYDISKCQNQNLHQIIYLVRPRSFIKKIVPYPPENKPPSKISPLPSLTVKFLHRYACLDYKPPSHQVEYTRIYTCMRAQTYVRNPALQLTTSSDIQPPNFTDFSADYLLVEYQCSSIRR